MNIGIVVDNGLNDDKRVLREAEILKEAGHVIFVLCFSFDNKEYEKTEGIDITRISISRKLKNTLFFFMNTVPAYEWLWSAKIKEFIVTKGINALHVHDLYMSKAGWSGIKKSGRRIPIILDLHENYPYAVTTYNWTKGFPRSILSRPWVWQKKEKEYLGYAEKIIVLSDEFRDTIIERYPALTKDRFTVFPNVPDLYTSVPLKTFSPVTVFPRDKIVLFYFGVVAERRGIFDVLDIFEELTKENYPLRFLIIGPVDKKDRDKFLGIINSEALTDLVFYIPWINLSELQPYLDVADICIAPFHKNPQHESGVANKIFDYMLGKKPVIASDCKPQARIIEKHYCGLIYRDKAELRKAIQKLGADSELRKKMGENGYNAIVSEYNTGMMKERLTALYRDIQS